MSRDELHARPERSEAQIAGQHLYAPYQVSSPSPIGLNVKIGYLSPLDFPRRDYGHDLRVDQLRLLAQEKGRSLLKQGEQQLQLGNIEDGIRFFEEGLTLLPRSVEYARVIRLLVQWDSIDLARVWAKKAHSMFPNDSLLSRWFSVLSLPQTRKVPVKTTARNEELRWLETNAAQYRGKWVVLSGSQLAGCANTLQEALQQARERGFRAGTLCHWIPD